MSLCEKRCRTTNIVASAKEDIDRASGTTAIGGVSMTMKSNKLFMSDKEFLHFFCAYQFCGIRGDGAGRNAWRDSERGLNR